MRRLLLAIGLLAIVAIIVAEVARGAEPGRVQYRLDAKSYADSIPLEWFGAHVQRIMAYPPAGDRYTASVPTLAYHDAWTTWGSQGATHISEYVAWAKRDRERGYAGQFMDDVNFAGGNIAGTRAQYANLIEAVRQALGPEGILEINAQFWDIWSLIESEDPDVARALGFVNMIDKEFGVSESAAGINTSAKYAEFLAYVETLEAKGIHIDLVSSHPGDEYSLATYLLINDGGAARGSDFIGAKVTPETWWSGFEVNLGGPAYYWGSNGRPASAKHEPNGAWKRYFRHGFAIVDPPGNGPVTYSWGSAVSEHAWGAELPPMHTPNGATGLTSITLSERQGVVLSR